MYIRRFAQFVLFVFLIIPFQNCGGLRSFEVNGSERSLGESIEFPAGTGNSLPGETTPPGGSNPTPINTGSETSSSAPVTGNNNSGSGSRTPSGARLALYYGSVAGLGSVASAVGQLGYADVAVFPVNYISPLPKLQNADGCHFPAEEAQGPALIKALKNFKPSMKIFINVPGAADAPTAWGCGQSPPKALNDYWGSIREDVRPGNVLEADWSCPNGICTNFIILANAVKAVGADGISIEYAGPLYMNRFVRDSEISYAKSLGLKVMLNVAVTRPDFFEWAAQSSYLESGDYLSLEGYYSMGPFESAANAQAVNKIYQSKFSSKVC